MKIIKVECLVIDNLYPYVVIQTDINPFPKNESLKDTFNRLKPFLTSKLFPLIEKGKNILTCDH